MRHSLINRMLRIVGHLVTDDPNRIVRPQVFINVVLGACWVSNAPHIVVDTDGGAMYLLVNAGGKYWRMNYRFAEKRKTLALGVYPVAK